MMDFGAVSIIVPVYNVEKYLVQCLQSLTRQTYQNLQIVLVDDGSTDLSGSICDQWAEQDHRITVIHKMNEGLSAARNDGLDVAHGKYICFVDSDDWLELDAITKSVAEAESKQADIVFFPYVRETNSDSREVHFYEDSRAFCGSEVQDCLVRRLIGPVGDELAHPERMDWFSTAWGKLYGTQIIRENKLAFTHLREIGTFEDGFFNIAAFSHAHTVVYLNECFYHYRRMDVGQLTSAYKPKFFEQTEHLYSEMENMPEVRSTQKGLEALRNRVALGLCSQAIIITSSGKSIKDKREELSNVLLSKRYREALRQLSVRGMPVHWKVFYGLSKIPDPTAVLLIAEVMRRLKDRRNK